MKTATLLNISITLLILLNLNSCTKSITDPPVAKKLETCEVVYCISPAPGYLEPVT
jgi:hypothetical protein